MIKFSVYVDDNFKYMDELSRYKLGEFDSWDEALKASKKIVDDYLLDAYKNTVNADELLSSYRQFGQDPFIVGGDEGKRFSAWEYAATRCQEIFEGKA